MQNQSLVRRNARGSIGVDTTYLDKQIEEKRLRDALIAHQEKQEAEYMQELSKRLDEYEAAANIKMSQKLQDLRRTLEEQVRQPKNNALAEGIVDFDKVGQSSIQIFDGEDDAHTERKNIQQQQLKVWCSELMAEKERARLEERKREQQYASQVLQKDRTLEHMEEEIRQRKEEIAKSQQLENMKMAREAKLRRKMELQAEKEADAAQARHLQTCQLLTEDKSVVANQSQPHRVRPDHFKGFDKDQIHSLYRENDAVMEEKHKKAAQEADQEAEWARHEAEMLRRMDEAEQLRQQRIAEDNRNYGNTLHMQREEKIRNAKTEVVGIGTNFFERFGSCR
mmetsp:Transcript_3320/g.5094  ORF Transcript_3320/g.5094 Transcript_3320/m.5094 type:complete len:338 (-) Transcript_3320:54-1067(-)|eukprot:CAMPEP_0201717264 /NCGR_PEP_ID=MMETSP0593-20130828/3019_1 /ASSEMBLY_ACC=CAM_ASM_000672 /TAXON_ID=267983 /ORGANISM="Skeletonema japonicum, Strain CCMP2506" /LENGTH=337 /DNA_ID=CAMNT_0048207247 /DNA_START=72 /DNA_END=1085 /DNA_ORIENTATION=-